MIMSKLFNPIACLVVVLGSLLILTQTGWLLNKLLCFVLAVEYAWLGFANWKLLNRKG